MLEKKIAEITYIEKQQDIKGGLELHGIRLDIFLEDDNKTQYAVEMQTGSAFDLERRIRYYQSSLDRRTLEFLRYINAKNHKLPYDVSGSDYLTKIGRAEWEHNAKVGLVKRLLARAMSLEDIADACDLDLDEVKKIADEA